MRESLILLLEFARASATMVRELESGSWSADLLTSTGHLVRCEVHPDLRPLVLPAKMLQNTLARGPPAPARSN